MSIRPPRPLGPLALAGLFLCCQLLLAGCEEKGPFGLSEERFSQILATKNSAALVALPEKALADLGPHGVSTLYYAARWLDDLVPPAPPKPASPGTAPEGPDPQAGTQTEIPPALSEVGLPESVSLTYLGPARARVRTLYRLALQRCEGLVRSEAGASLVAAALADARAAAASPQAQTLWNEVLSETRLYREVLGPSPEVKSARLEALDALGRDAELQRELAEYRSLFPTEAQADPSLGYYEGSSARRLGKKVWAPALVDLLQNQGVSDWTAKAYAFVQAQAGQTEISPEVLALARMRLGVRSKDYGPAWRACLEARSLVFTPKATKDLISDAGKAALYSGSSREALDRFVLWSEGRGEAAWTANYYRARFYRALERWPEALALFGSLSAAAPTPADGDNALWYWADTKIKALEAAQAASPQPKKPSPETLAARASALRAKELEVLVDASNSWSDPKGFSDLADTLLRAAIVAKDWAFVGDFAALLGPRLTPLLGARSAYTAGRALELGLFKAKAPPPPPSAKTVAAKGSKKGPATKLSPQPLKPAEPVQEGPEAANADRPDGPSLPPTPGSYFLTVTTRPGVPQYYRILAEYKLGMPLDLLPPAGPSGPAPAPGATGEVEAFIQGFIDLGLTAYAYPEARARLARPEGGAVDPGALRHLAHAAAAKGDFATSMRIILILPEGSDWRPERGDYELIYPRPYLDELRGIRPKPDVEEYILYGLLRSESFFRPDVVSDAGAIGLAQIMPTTAQDIARRLGMASYDLRVPSDNLRMGAAHFSSLLRSTGNRPLRAMFAYNAGAGRLKRWLADLPGLPDDLLLESLSIEETRQYGRNILQASVFYGELYYGMDGRAAVEGVLGAGKTIGD